MAKQNYTIDKNKKIITATISQLDETEKDIVQMYINAGYILHKGKSNPWNKKSIEKWLKENAEEKDVKEFKTKAEEDWVSARTWFFETFPASKKASKEKTKSSK